MTHALRYSTDQLIALASVAPVSLSHDVQGRVRQLGISCRHRGCRSGKSARSKRMQLQLKKPVATALTSSGNRPSPRCRRVYYYKNKNWLQFLFIVKACLLYTSPSPRDGLLSRMPSSA